MSPTKSARPPAVADRNGFRPIGVTSTGAPSSLAVPAPALQFDTPAFRARLAQMQGLAFAVLSIAWAYASVLYSTDPHGWATVVSLALAVGISILGLASALDGRTIAGSLTTFLRGVFSNAGGFERFARARGLTEPNETGAELAANYRLACRTFALFLLATSVFAVGLAQRPTPAPAPAVAPRATTATPAPAPPASATGAASRAR